MSNRFDGIWTFIWRLAVFGMVLLVVVRSFPATERARAYQAHTIAKLDAIETKLRVLDTFVTQEAYEADKKQMRVMIHGVTQDLEEIRRHIGLPPRVVKSPR